MAKTRTTTTTTMVAGQNEEQEVSSCPSGRVTRWLWMPEFRRNCGDAVRCIKATTSIFIVPNGNAILLNLIVVRFLSVSTGDLTVLFPSFFSFLTLSLDGSWRSHFVKLEIALYLFTSRTILRDLQVYTISDLFLSF